MDDQSFKNMGIDFLSPNASILNYQDTGNVHIGGLFESLSPLPVYEWAENDDSDWMDFGNICREDECEVSVLYLRYFLITDNNDDRMFKKNQNSC
jgi:hypothetical protein